MSEASLMSPERDESTESSLETSIANAQSFDDLLSILESVTEFPGSSKVYSKDQIISAVNEAREQADITRVPRTHGLRAKVGDLLELEARSN